MPCRSVVDLVNIFKNAADADDVVRSDADTKMPVVTIAATSTTTPSQSRTPPEPLSPTMMLILVMQMVTKTVDSKE